MSMGTKTEREKMEIWLHDFHDGSKSLNADPWLDTFFTEDCSVLFGNNGVISGPAFRQMFKDLFNKLDGLAHDVDYFDYVSPRIYQAAAIRYLVKGDDPEKDEIQIPGFATYYVKEAEGGKIRCYRAEMFGDMTPVFQRIAEKGL